MSIIDTIRTALYGSPPSQAYQPSKEGVIEAFDQMLQSVSVLTGGVVGSTATIRATKTLLLATSPANDTLGLVYNDPTTANNGIYHRTSGVWVFTELLGTGPEGPGPTSETITAATAVAVGAANNAEVSAASAAVSEAMAEVLVGPNYASTSAGIAATINGQSFAVDNGDGTVDIYRNTAGTAVLQRRLATTSALAASAGAALIGFLRNELGSVSRTVEEVLQDRASVRDFGAIGDGTLHTVAEWIIPGALGRFANLAALQVEYPHVTATTESIDWAAIQAAVNASRNVYIPQQTGAFYYSNKNVVCRQDTVVHGANKQNTVVKFFNSSGFTATSTGLGAYDLQLINFSIFGDGSGVTWDGINIDGSGSNFGRVKLDCLVISGFSRDGISMTKPIVTEISLIQSSDNGQHGFNIEGDGTSVHASLCYASGNDGVGWRLGGRIQYSAFTACASDGNTSHGWHFDGTVTIAAEGITMNSCGSESNLGDQFKFTCTLGLTLNSIFTFPGDPVAGGHFINLNGARHVALNGIRMARNAPVGKFALNLDSAGGTQFPGDISLNGSIFSSTNATPDQITDVNAQPRFKTGTGTYSNGDIITHGLGITPTHIDVNTGSATTAGAAVISSIGPTTFQITIWDVASVPAATVTGQNCTWQVSWQG